MRILTKPSDLRTKAEVKTIAKILYRLKCFDHYPIQVKQELAKVVYLDRFEDGRIIIKQCHPGLFFYFIVSGAVTVERTEWDPVMKKCYVQKVGELQSGDSFGGTVTSTQNVQLP